MASRSEKSSQSPDPAIGVGALVAVASPEPGNWPGNPVGVVVAPAGDAWGYPGTASAKYWTVSFEHPALPASGDAAVEQATLPAEWLRLLDAGTIADADLPPELRES